MRQWLAPLIGSSIGGAFGAYVRTLFDRRTIKRVKVHDDA